MSQPMTTRMKKSVVLAVNMGVVLLSVICAITQIILCTIDMYTLDCNDHSFKNKYSIGHHVEPDTWIFKPRLPFRKEALSKFSAQSPLFATCFSFKKIIHGVS